MRKWRCVKVNNENRHNFTVGKTYETDDNMLNCKTDNGYVLKNVRIIENEDSKIGLIFEEVFEKKGEKKVNKFKVGDIVEIIGNCNEHCFKVGEKVKLYELWDNEDVGNGVAFLAQRINGKFSKRNVVRTKDLKMDESSTKIFTITVSDSSTTLTSDDKTVSINRYYTDKHDVKVAVNEVVKKYFDEVERIKIEDEIGDKLEKLLKDNGISIDDAKRILDNKTIREIGKVVK